MCCQRQTTPFNQMGLTEAKSVSLTRENMAHAHTLLFFLISSLQTSSNKQPYPSSPPPPPPTNNCAMRFIQNLSYTLLSLKPMIYRLCVYTSQSASGWTKATCLITQWIMTSNLQIVRSLVACPWRTGHCLV